MPDDPRHQSTFATLPNCDACGRFHRQAAGASWAMRYSGWPPTPDHEAFRCASCTARLGALPPQPHPSARIKWCGSPAPEGRHPAQDCLRWMGGSVDEPADCRGCVHLVVKENQGDA